MANVTYSSIRIYLPNPSIITGFYDIIGYSGLVPTIENGVYLIDCINSFPVIKKGVVYYTLTYDSATASFLASIVEDTSSITLLENTELSIPIFRGYKGDDSEAVLGNPLTASIDIQDLANKRSAYRRYTLEIYDNYAIQLLDQIEDAYSIIDEKDIDVILVPINNDNITCIPAANSVIPNDTYTDSWLYSFTLTFTKQVILNNINKDIVLYDGITQVPVSYVDSRSFTINGNSISFNLTDAVEVSSVYYLYIPLDFFKYIDDTTSSLTIFKFVINTASEENPTNYIISPVTGFNLSKINILFPNVSAVDSYDNFSTITVEHNGTVDEYSSRIALTKRLNNVELRFATSGTSDVVYSNPGEYIITIPGNTITPKNQFPLLDDIVITYTVISEEDTPLLENVSFEVSPDTEASYFSISNFTIILKVADKDDDNNIIKNVIVSNAAASALQIKNSSGEVIGTTTDVRNLGSTQLEGKSAVVTYQINLGKVYKNTTLNSIDTYTIEFPKGYFSVTYTCDSETITQFSDDIVVTYKLNPINAEEGDEGDYKTFYRELLKVKANSEANVDNVAVKKNDTIFINKQFLSSIETTPNLSATTYNDDGSIKDIFIIDNYDGTVALKLSYKNSDGVSIVDAKNLIYGHTYSLIPELINDSNYPDEIDLEYTFFYKGRTLVVQINLQLLEYAIYQLVRNGDEIIRTASIDVYSGQQLVNKYGSLITTDDYDEIVQIPITVTSEGGESTEFRNAAELVPITKSRMGNLSGIYNEKFGANQPKGYGLYGESVYLTGNFYLENGKSLIDIDNDVLLAVGATKEIKEGLTKLDNDIRTNVNILANNQAALKAGLNTTIKNYISTNKNSVLKIGLDYSLWALGNAGITLINPGAKYIIDPITGNYNVDESTVGDGDEYLALQGNKIYFNINEQKDDYYKVICTYVDPNTWIYDKDVYYPTDSEGEPIKFFVGYVNRYFKKVYKINTSGEILRYVALPKDLEDNELVECVQFDDQDVNTYSFSNYYKYGDSSNTSEEQLGILTDDGFELYDTSKLIFFVPKVDTVAAFDSSGKLDARFISAENITAVDTRDSEVYIKNKKFNPALDITVGDDYTPSNFPVLKVDESGNLVAAPEANYVVISGTTGKLTAKGADIRGNIIIGDQNSSYPYILLTDGSFEGVENYQQNNPAFYIMHEDKCLLELTGTEKPASTNFISNFVEPYTAFQELGISLGITTTTLYKNYIISPYDIITREFSVDEVDGYQSNPDEVDFDEYITIDGSRGIYIDEWEKHNDGWGGNIFVERVSYSERNKRNITDADDEESGYGQIMGTTVKYPIENRELKAGEVCTLTGNLSYTLQPNFNLPNIYYYVRAYLSIAIIGEDDDNNTYELKYFTTDSYAAEQYRTGYDWSYKTGYYGKANSTLKIHSQKIVNNKSTTLKLYVVIKPIISYTIGESVDVDHAWHDTTSYVNSHIFRVQRTSRFDYDVYDRWSISQFRDTCTLQLSATINTLKLDIGTANYKAAFFANGEFFGYDFNNYFTTYFLGNDADTYNKNRMVFDFQSSGCGLKFDNGKYYNYLGGKSIAAFIPIVQGKITYINGSEAKEHTYQFKGISLVGNSEYTNTSANHGYTRRPPFYLNTRDSGGMWWWKWDDDSRGRPVNIDWNGDKDGRDGWRDTGNSKFKVQYSTEDDLYIIRVSVGQLIIVFGSKWETLLGKNFLNPDYVNFSINGIGRYEATTNYSGWVETGPIYATIKAVQNRNPHMSISNPAKLIIYANSEDNDSTLFNSTDNSPEINNWLEIDLADDSSFNDGSFYLTINYCPNKQAQ